LIERAILADVSFGEWLKRRRKGMGLTQRQLAARINCSTVMLKKIEAEQRRASVQMVERLAEIFNIPQNELSSFLKYARGDWRHAPVESIGATPWRAGTSPRTNLPAPITSFLGRENEQKEVLDLLAKHRLVTLIGPPGIGKTRLSIEAARLSLPDFPDGVFFVALAPLNDPTLISSTTLQVLGYVESKNLPAEKQLMEGIRDKRMLIVLDNCEHLIEDVASLASNLLSACPRLKILTTSREALRVMGEQLYPVPALEFPKEGSALDVDAASAFSALTLFAERARSVRPDFALNAENLPAVSTICAKLDGLPLAIELFAARMRLMTPQILLEKLDEQFILSADGMRAVPARQRTLKDAIGWGYNLLSLEEQKLFAYLSVYSGGFILDMAEGMFADSFPQKTVSDLVLSLFDKSLLQRISDADKEIRYAMFVTIREFARTRLRELGAETEIRDRHFAYFLHLAIRADEEIHGPDQVAWINRLKQEMDNFRSALEWCLSRQNTHSALCLVSALSWFLGLWQHKSELRGWFDKVQALGGLDDHPLLYAQLLNRVGYSNWLAGDFHYARSALEKSITIWRGLGSDGTRGLAEALCSIGMVAHSIDSDYDTARSLFQQSLELYQQCRYQWGIAHALFNLGWVDDHTDKDETAQQQLEQSLNTFTSLGDLWGMGVSSRFLGQFFLKKKKFEKAGHYFNQHLAIDERLEFRSGIVVALGNLGDLYRHTGEYERAEQYYRKSLEVCREYGIKIDRGYNFFALGMLGLQRNDYSFAARHILRYFESGAPVSRVLAAGDLCMGMAAAAGGMHQPERSAKLYGAAQALLKIMDIPYTPFDRAIFDLHIRMARDEFEEEKFEALVAEGRAMTMEQAIAYALEN
jgi:predicted ATPase/DNA-binding XRE family transcriptional regulator